MERRGLAYADHVVNVSASDRCVGLRIHGAAAHPWAIEESEHLHNRDHSHDFEASQHPPPPQSGRSAHGRHTFIDDNGSEVCMGYLST